jgi:hypothetical protein
MKLIAVFTYIVLIMMVGCQSTPETTQIASFTDIPISVTNTPLPPTKTPAPTDTAIPSTVATQAPLSDYAAQIPDLEIPEYLFSPDEGTSNLYESPLYSDGGWHIMRSIWTESVLPVPSGWTMEEPGENVWSTLIAFSKDGSVEDLSPGTVWIILAVEGDHGDTKSSEQTITEVEYQFSGNLDWELLEKEIIDTEKAYLLYRMLAEEETQYFLMVYSREPLSEDGNTGGWFRSFMAITYESDWTDYYPIIRAIQGNWYGIRHDNPLGVELPVELDVINMPTVTPVSP